MADLEPDSLFAGHRIEGVVGRGGMGVMYRARHVELDVTRALKVIVPEHSEDPEFRARFKREWRLAARIEHPNVIPVHEVGEENGVLFISMRYIDGQDVGELIESEGALDPKRVAHIVDQVAYALDEAHAAGLVHRDVKPANVLIEQSPRGEWAYLTDFGLTKPAASKTAMTASGMFVGTIDYMAPEQFEGDSLDGRADVYSLGCMLYQMLTARIPFEGDDFQSRIFGHLTGEPPRPSAAVELLPKEFDDIVAKAMAKKPGERYQSAGDLGRAAVEAASAEPALRDAPPPPPPPPPPPQKPEDEPSPEPEPSASKDKAEAKDTPWPPRAPSPPGKPAPPGPRPKRERSDGVPRVVLLAIAGVAAVAVIVVIAVLALSGGDSPPTQTEKVESALNESVASSVPGAEDADFSCEPTGTTSYHCEDQAGNGSVEVSSRGTNSYGYTGTTGGLYSGRTGSFTVD